jgi:hypothetical protein
MSKKHASNVYSKELHTAGTHQTPALSKEPIWSLSTKDNGKKLQAWVWSGLLKHFSILITCKN